MDLCFLKLNLCVQQLNHLGWLLHALLRHILRPSWLCRRSRLVEANKLTMDRNILLVSVKEVILTWREYNF